jgi:hypothetical protein
MMKQKLTNEILLMDKEQLLEAIKEVVNDSVQSSNKRQKTYVYGINGLAFILGCSRPTAQRIKSTGKLDEAISQNGRTIVVNVEKALELIRLDRKYNKKYPYVPSRRIN